MKFFIKVLLWYENMKKRADLIDHLVIFLISFVTISLELFLTRILNLKSWNHVVYVVIPFAILGYGIGANIYLLLKEKIQPFEKRSVIRILSLLIAYTILLSTFLIIRLPIKVTYLLSMFTSGHSIVMLLASYTVYMIPFIFIGFLVVYLFANNRSTALSTLYFFDLMGAGLASLLFAFLINRFQVLGSLSLLTFFMVLIGLLCFPQVKWRWGGIFLFMTIFIFIFPWIRDPNNYVIDERKGWEWIPGYFSSTAYQEVSSRWHPLGRTDVYRIVDPAVREQIYGRSPGTFQINVRPRPEFCYFSTNFLAGTPVYKLSPKGLEEHQSRLALFTESMETPYLLFNDPKVFIIGVGGGRDIFMARSHGATEIYGAEINPGIVQAMRPGGVLHDYSGGVYTLKDVHVHLVDGRHLVKKFDSGYFDVIVLNGVDTFSGLSSGAYAYAESYLYTKDALKDYLKVLKPDGIINFNRWLFPDMPRETLRLHAISLQALKEIGAVDPSKHIIIGASNGWSLVLIKRSEFKAEEVDRIDKYFLETNTTRVYPATESLQLSQHPLLNFQIYADFFKENKQHVFEYHYPYDVSVITDDTPFFYKYYKFNSFNPFRPFAIHHTGPIIFMTQFVVFLQAFFFIVLFILGPLCWFKRTDIYRLPKQALGHFIIYFSCLGFGFMLIEIPLMQKFVLLLGTPIHSIVTVLSSLLLSMGLGSFALTPLQQRFPSSKELLSIGTFLLVGYLLLFIGAGPAFNHYFLPFSTVVRIFVVVLLIFPLGFLLGLYFPLGLQLISRKYQDTVAWAWGINSGFSVLGSIVAIIIAQMMGFNAVLSFGAVVYLIGLLSFRQLEARILA